MASKTPLGKEVLNIPFGEIIREVATGIAEAQFDLDKTSMLVAELMSGQQVLRDSETGQPILKDGEAQIIDSTIQFGHSYQSIGEGATARAIIGDGQIKEIIVNNPGRAYVEAPEVEISGGGGEGAIARAIMENGTVASIELTTPGSGYSSVPFVNFKSTEGKQATARASILNGAINEITLINQGSKYVEAPQVFISGGGGEGAIATAEVAGGELSSIVIEFGGSGYTSVPTIRLAPPPPAFETPATAIAFISAKVVEIEMTNGGSGYQANALPEVEITGGAGVGAKAKASIEDGNLAVDIEDGGDLYEEAPTVKIISKVSVNPNRVSMMELGFAPNFYQFVDTVIDLKLAMRVNKGRDNKLKISAATVDANYASSYNYDMKFSTSVKTKIVPIPPPVVLEERLRQIIADKSFLAENKDLVINPPTEE